MKRAFRPFLLLGMLLSGLGAAESTQAPVARTAVADNALPLVHGPLWNNSTQAEKRAYLIGVANTLVVGEAVAAKKRGEDPTASMNRMAKAINLQTIEQSVAEIDAWYKANPSREDLPVIGVIYLRIVQDKKRNISPQHIGSRI